MKLVEQAHDTDIRRIVTETFVSMLATDVTVCPPLPHRTDIVTSMISFGGAWKGGVAFECGPEQAVLFARRFLQDDSINEISDDVCDSLGEMANIIAGNLKTVLGSNLTLGTPSVVVGKDYRVHFCGGKLLSCCDFSSDAGTFTVRLVEEPS